MVHTRYISYKTVAHTCHMATYSIYMVYTHLKLKLGLYHGHTTWLLSGYTPSIHCMSSYDRFKTDIHLEYSMYATFIIFMYLVYTISIPYLYHVYDIPGIHQVYTLHMTLERIYLVYTRYIAGAISRVYCVQFTTIKSELGPPFQTFNFPVFLDYRVGPQKHRDHSPDLSLILCIIQNHYVNIIKIL
jgi:hypothetical protein